MAVVCPFMAMTPTREAFLAAADSAGALLRDPAVADAWESPSALPGFRVSGLAGHLAYQVVTVPVVLAEPLREEEPVTLLEHYARAAWVGAAADDEVNHAIRVRGEHHAANGAGAVADQVAAITDFLRADLPAERRKRVVQLSQTQWPLRLDDFLVTRMMEIAVHSDDLAVSAGVATPPLPDAVLTPVLGLLSALALRRHGQPAVLRALSRAERAPASITAF